ncbi:Oligopeptide transport system permease protein AppC [Halomicronema hongdechloris C2206]|uniref:Oligopeptide transport system permease protein AppC n=1 Tax=Halomicronema hongdechloris C2206 TaxID=1641165 RepID=A0A1Z3HQT4_9CYAN|nr:ABC transporter permease [Halomicronema hongdechloris]ASC72684.1 Oligopeptide transport system permease protein AppC [Halomicronema hongdechloris C2206]
MTWWQKLTQNSLARVGLVILTVFYAVVIFADVVAPYDPYVNEPNGSLLPPTEIYWRQQLTGEWIGPHVYPTTQGPVDIDTGERNVTVDYSEPSPIRLWVAGKDYHLFRLVLPLPTRWSLSQPRFQETVLWPGIAGNRHLFGTVGPGKLHLLGTDEQARDQFSRLIFGGRISLSVGVIGIILSFPLGLLVGGLSGYFGGAVDAILMRLVEMIMTIPDIYLLVALAAVLPPTLSSGQRFLLIILITSFVRWTGLARVIRGQVLSIKEQEFVQAARAMGGRSLYIITRHVLPQTATYAIIAATLAIPSFIVAEAILSLIGLGIQQPDPSWGNMLSNATNASILVLQPWLIWPPALLIVVTVLCFNLLGDGLRDALDPRTLK